jgi:hypothetical protein
LRDAIGVYAHGAMQDLGDLAGNIDSAMDILVSANADAATFEMSPVREFLEHDKVSTKHAIDDFPAFCVTNLTYMFHQIERE